MKINRIYTSLSMILKMLLRRKIVLILILLIPTVFLSIVEFTSAERVIPFQLASVGEQVFINMPEKSISFIFFSVASAGFLVSFLALNLIQKNHKANKRLILCGYHPLELLSSILLVLIVTILLIAIYIGILTIAFTHVDHPVSFTLSLALIGFVYGSYGMAVGSLVKGELEAILLVVLLVNIDVGWLQNPIFYAGAQNQVIIEFLPAYFPSQASMVKAFTNYSAISASLYALSYGMIFLIISMLVFFFKMRTK